MVDARVRGRSDSRLGVERHAEPGLFEHRKIVRAIPYGEGLPMLETPRGAQFAQTRKLGLAAEDRLCDDARERIAVRQQKVGAVLVEADEGRDLGRERREAARYQGTPGAVRLHRRDEGLRAGRQREACGYHFVDNTDRQPLQQRDALPQRRLERDLAAHGAFGDRGHAWLQAREISKLVDALLTDDGGIHIGYQQPLATVCGRLHDDVDLGFGKIVRQGARHLVGVEAGFGCERHIGGYIVVEPMDVGDAGERVGGTAHERLTKVLCGGVADQRGHMRHRGRNDSLEMEAHVTPDRFLIAGPTASGKTALALALARETGATIVNADSMQVYSDLRVLTARPTRDEEQRATHRLFGTVDGAVNFSVGHWLNAVAPLLRLQEPLIFVGGTGLYFKTLTQGVSAIPNVPPEIRARVRLAAEGRVPDDLHAELAARDPATAARLRPSDPQRILRALEVFEATGRSLASFQGARQPPLLPPGSFRAVFLDVDRTTLRDTIDVRFVKMIDAGALDEVRALAARELDPMLPVMRAHGVPGLLAHLRGETALEDAIARGIRDTQHYAKRQVTFARHQLPEFAFVSARNAFATLRGA